ncbi:MAG: putative Diguanylate cyclase/phosphodiesterase [Frankiales bacterium]|nr:putative Diguanylate cyclase/phosphodiesterase [Frankiales bacterium]
MRRLPADTGVWLLTAGLAAAAAAATFLWVTRLPGSPLDAPLPWPALLAAFVLAEMCVIHVRVGKEMYSSSLDEIPLVVGLFLVDPVTLLVVRLLGRGAVLLLHRRHRPVKVAFNLAQWSLEAAVVVLLWHGLTAGGQVVGPRGWLAAFTAVLAADLLSAASVSAAIRLSGTGADGGLTWTELWSGTVASAANVCMALVATAVVIVDWRASWTLVVVGALLYLAHRSHGGLRERHDSLERLNRFTERISADLDVRSVAHAVLLEARALVAAERAELVLPDIGVLSCTADMTLQSHGDVTSSLAHRLRGRLLDHAVLVPRGTRDEMARAWLRETSLRDAVVVPLRIDERIIGTLTVADNLGDTGTFSAADAQLLEALANHAAVAVENARLAQRLLAQVVEQQHQARHDPLTGLPNRLGLHERAAALLDEGLPFAVLLVDLDDFKDVNDTLGHAIGDELLVLVAARVRALDLPGLFVSRLGGDEFVLLAQLDGGEQAQRAAEQVHAVLASGFPLDGVTVGVAASIGIALAPRDGTDASSLLRRADIAMYAAKGDGTGSELYSAAIDEHTAERLAMAAELRAALQTGALAVAYQPKVDVVTGRVLGVEALARWSHPLRGYIPPDEFVPVAERTGQIGELTRTVLDRALAQCAAWRSAGLELDMAVNLSPMVLRDEAFESDLAALLARYDVPPQALTLEVTEGSLMADVERTTSMLKRLRKLGVHLSIDDLGTGYSSLAYLKRLPVDEVKLDKSFVLQLATNLDDQAIVRAMVDVGHRLRMRVVAEGVEDVESFALLRALGCDVAQGYWISRPLRGPDVPAWSAAWSSSAAAPGLGHALPAASRVPLSRAG